MPDSHLRDDRQAGAASRPGRRRFLAVCAAAGVGGTLFPRALWSRIQEAGRISEEAVAEAEKVAGLEFTDEERRLLLDELQDYPEAYRSIRELGLPNEVPPALCFDPLAPGIEPPAPEEQRPIRLEVPAEAPARISTDSSSGASGAGARSPREPEPLPDDPDEIAFLSVSRLARALRDREITSLELTEIYLGRLRRYDPVLHCIVSLTEDRARSQARRADRELDAGTVRGPLHGVPCGVKDLLATRDAPTTWGAAPYRDQTIPDEATVVRRLDEAGAVLVAKLSLGALAWGDVWFDAKTRNPWKPDEGSSGSSAGSAAATAAGLVAFAIGTETLGSIVSPCTRCGATGLRPTFGRVSRAGAMALSWSMDKIGPICRNAQDCALVLSAIHGADGRDAAARTLPFNWDGRPAPEELRIGYLKSAFTSDDERYTNKPHDLETLRVLRDLGFSLIEVEMPEFPSDALSFILDVEAAAAFDELTRSGRDELLVRQVENAWPNVFRRARLVPAVEYVQANRARTLLMRRLDEALREVDLFVTPSYGGGQLLITNLTGHPCVVVPNGFEEDGTPVSVSFVGRLYREADALAVAHAYQRATDFHRSHPDMSAWKPTPNHPPDAEYLR